MTKLRKRKTRLASSPGYTSRLNFADAAVSESSYRLKLKRLKKEESDLLKCQRNIDPAELGEIVSLGISIDMVKNVLNKGSLLVTDYGIFGELKDAFGITDKHGFEMTDMVMGAIEVPPGSCEGKGLLEKQGTTKSAQRAILQSFSIRVIVYPERVEIKGTIPTQILDKTDKEETARIITSPCLVRRGGRG